MKQSHKQEMPPGWTPAQMRKLVEYYDHQSEEESVADIERALSEDAEAIVVVPKKLVPAVKRLVRQLTKSRAG